MKNNKLIQLLKTFSSNEIKRLNDYVATPFFNKNKTLARLLLLISKQYPHFESPKVQKETLYAQIAGKEKPYNDGIMRNWISQLFAICQDFTAYLGYETNKHQQSIFLLEYYYKQNNEPLFEETMQKAQQNLQTQGIDLWYFLNKAELDMAQNALMRRKYRSNPVYLSQHFNHADEFESLSNYYFNRLLQLSYHYHYLKKFLPNEQDYNNEQLNIGHIEKTVALYPNLHEINRIEYWKLQLAISQEPSYFLLLKDWVLHKLPTLRLNFDKLWLRVLHITLCNYANARIENGQTEYMPHYIVIFDNQIRLDLHLMQLDTQIALEKNGYMSYIVYCAYLGNYAQAEQFLQQFKPLLLPDEQENTYHYCRSIILFYQQQYTQALDILENMTAQETPYVKIGMRRLSAQLLYETQQFLRFEPYLDAYIHYLNSPNIGLSALRLEIEKNFAHCLARLYRLLKRPNTKRIDAICADMEHLQLSYYKQWLLDKVKEVRGEV